MLIYQWWSEKAIKIVLHLPTAYLCEAGFSSYTSVKTTYYNRLNAEVDMKALINSIKPDIAEI